MLIYTAQQGTPEWHEARAGVITGSMFATARERLKKSGEPTSAARDYAFRLAVERISGQPLDDGFETWAMKRGRELEPEARAAHEAHARVVVEPCGFVTTDDGLFGASADGLILDDGGAEYKCLVSPERLRETLITNDISDYMDQVQGGMWITGRSDWHFVMYSPALAGIEKHLFLRVVKRDEAYIEAMARDLLDFAELVNEFQERLKKPLPEAA